MGRPHPFELVIGQQQWDAGVSACVSEWPTSSEGVLRHLRQVRLLASGSCEHNCVDYESTPKGWNAWCVECGASAWAYDRWAAIDLVEAGKGNIELPTRDAYLYVLTCCHELSKTTHTSVQMRKLLELWRDTLDEVFGDSWYGNMCAVAPFEPFLDDAGEGPYPGVSRNGAVALLLTPHEIRVLSDTIDITLPHPLPTE